MTGFESKRQMAQDKMTDESDTLTIVYQRGFADGKRAAERKPLTDEEIVDIRRKTKPTHDRAWADTISFARAVEAAHNIKEQP